MLAQRVDYLGGMLDGGHNTIVEIVMPIAKSLETPELIYECLQDIHCILTSSFRRSKCGNPVQRIEFCCDTRSDGPTG